MIIPILYSYRRCPYAIRARMALRYSQIDVEIREISLRNKPSHMVEVSPKGTVPVLVLTDGKVIEQSLDIIDWAFSQSDPSDLRLTCCPDKRKKADDLITENDGYFKSALDRYKYADRFPEMSKETYRDQGVHYLERLESELSRSSFLCGNQLSVADIAIFPFVRQFAAVDETWFNNSNYLNLRTWLDFHLRSELFLQIMQKNPTYMG